MFKSSEHRIVPRNGHTLVVVIVARISGCANQKDLSLEDQIDHAKEIVADLYDGPVEYRVIATKRASGKSRDMGEDVFVLVLGFWWSCQTAEHDVRHGKMDIPAAR